MVKGLPMNIKHAAIAAFALSTMSAPAFAAINNTPVPITNYITFGGNDWAWAMPCPVVQQQGVACGDSPTLDLSFQSAYGWHVATALELASGPVASDFGSSGNFKCAAAWFNNLYSHCDFIDANSGAIYNGAGGGLWYDETWVTRVSGGGGIPEPATWAMMIIGFGMVGTAMRRRRTLVAAA